MKILMQHFRFFVFLLIITAVFQACDEEESPPPDPINPDDLRYEGTWEGSTSQTRLLKIFVENPESGPIIRECRLNYVNAGTFKRRFITSPSGLSGISDGSFFFDLPDGGSIAGQFVSKNLCSGELFIADALSGKLTRHYFDLIPGEDSTNILSAAKVYFTIDGVSYEFVQDDIFYRPEFENINTGTGFLMRSGFVKQGNENINDQPVIWVNAGRIESADDIPEIFSPGIKRYAQFAVEGFEIIINDPGFYFVTFSTSNGTGSQTGSHFEIVDFKEVPTTDPVNKRYKFSASFKCKIYRMSGESRTVENGFYIGYVHTQNLP